MKIKLPFLGLLAGVALALTMCYPVRAQEKTVDSVAVTKPVFSGNEKNKVDSLISIGNAINDPAVQDDVKNIATQVNNMPKAGSPAQSYLTWGFGLLAAIMALVLLIKKKVDPGNTPAKK